MSEQTAIPQVDPKSVGNIERLSKILAERCSFSKAAQAACLAENRKAHPIAAPNARRTDQQAWRIGRLLRVSSEFVSDTVTREQASTAIALATSIAGDKSSLSVANLGRAPIASYLGVHLESADAASKARRTSAAVTVKSEVTALREQMAAMQAASDARLAALMQQMAEQQAALVAALTGGTVKANGRKPKAETQTAIA